MSDEKKQKTKDYQHEYYVKTRDKRREKVQCDNCSRQVCSEYLEKHKTKLICERRGTKLGE